MTKDFVGELRWRGMLHDIMPGTEELLKKESTAGYIGFDPTADSLHIGHLVQIMTLVQFQRAGHKPFALVGGATGMVGDPSGKSAERNLLSEDVLRHNEACVKKQLEKFLDFSSSTASAEMVNNYDWFKEYKFLDFIRDVGKHISVSYMMAKDSVQSRLVTGLSFTEFTYQLVQGYDFYWLYKNKGCRLQMGGSDQWGNIVTGTELIRRMDSGEAFALTTQLIKKADGTKFGKTEQGSVWLDPQRTSPYQFYQYWLNTSDEDAANFIKIFTLKNKDEIDALISLHVQAPHNRLLQLELAKDITIRVHSTNDYDEAVKATDILFNSKKEDLFDMDEPSFKPILKGLTKSTIKREVYTSTKTVTDLLSTATNQEIFASKSEARKTITARAVSINQEKIIDANSKPDFALIQNRYLVVKKGKKEFFLIEITTDHVF